MGTGQVQPGKPDYDQALRRLLLRGHSGFLSLIDPSLTWQGELSPELPAVARHADLVWEVGQPDGQRGILHIEIQTKSVVLFLRPAASVPSSPFVLEWMGREVLRYAFDVRYPRFKAGGLRGGGNAAVQAPCLTSPLSRRREEPFGANAEAPAGASPARRAAASG